MSSQCDFQKGGRTCIYVKGHGGEHYIPDDCQDHSDDIRLRILRDQVAAHDAQIAALTADNAARRQALEEIRKLQHSSICRNAQRDAVQIALAALQSPSPGADLLKRHAEELDRLDGQVEALQESLKELYSELATERRLGFSELAAMRQRAEAVEAALRIAMPFPLRVDGVFALPGEGHAVVGSVTELLSAIETALRLSPVGEVRIATGSESPQDEADSLIECIVKLRADRADAIERAEAAEAKLAANLKWAQGISQAADEKIVALTKERDEAREALKRYGVHLDACPARRLEVDDRMCVCGFHAAYQSAKAALYQVTPPVADRTKEPT